MSRTPRRRDHGITLVELMVTLVIASLVSASTFLFFAGQKQVYETQTKMLNVQQNLWASMETLSRHVRAAGTGMLGCVRPDPDGDGPLVADPPPGGDTPPQTGIRVNIGLDPIPDPYPGNTTRVAPLWIQNGGASAPDALVVAYGEGTSGNFIDASLSGAVSDGNSVIQTGTPGEARAFLADEMILLVNTSLNPLNQERGCTLFRVSEVNLGDGTLAHAGAWNPTGTTHFPPDGFTYAPNNSGIRNFGALRWVRFAIDDEGAAPALTMHRLDEPDSVPQVLAEGIEDLQIAYACDLQPPGANDGVLSEGANLAARQTDEWVYNHPSDVPPAQCVRPQAIRLTLVARSIAPDATLDNPSLENKRPAVEDREAGEIDSFRHRLLRTTIYPRN